MSKNFEMHADTCNVSIIFKLEETMNECLLYCYNVTIFIYLNLHFHEKNNTAESNKVHVDMFSLKKQIE